MPKCKVCKECQEPINFTVRNNLKTYHQKHGYCIPCYRLWLASDDPNAKIELDKVIIKGKANLKTEKKKEFKATKDEFKSGDVMKLADMYFSRYIRLKHSENGMCTCYTCGNVLPIKEIDNGHFMKREHKATRYHENNCRPQCKQCNGDTKHNGKQIEFRELLCNEIGVEMVEKIEALSKADFKANHLFYREKSDYYRIKVNELQKELKVKLW
jgi:hypothetical protein